jgi:SAM-dependent methyltransferase
MSTAAPKRGPFHGVLQIVRFNWPFYLASVSILVIAPFVVRRARRASLRKVGWMGWAGVAWWTTASLAASYWVYDSSPLMNWRWVRALLPEPPRRWLNIHAGLDESTLALRALFPESSGLTLDIFDEGAMSESSIRRARLLPSYVQTRAAAYNSLPVADGAVDAAFIFFAAHELRAPLARERFFREVARALAPGGRLLLAEHPRNTANLAAFGPGFWHFLPRSEWIRLARTSGLRIEHELTITPLVHIWSMEKLPEQPVP